MTGRGEGGLQVECEGGGKARRPRHFGAVRAWERAFFVFSPCTRCGWSAWRFWDSTRSWDQHRLPRRMGGQEDDISWALAGRWSGQGLQSIWEKDAWRGGRAVRLRAGGNGEGLLDDRGWAQLARELWLELGEGCELAGRSGEIQAGPTPVRRGPWDGRGSEASALEVGGALTRGA
jgi:hypothetical protein